MSKTDNIIKTLQTIDADLQALGWDRPASLYQLIEDEQDPSAELIGLLPTFPPVDLQAGYDSGARCPSEVHGLVCSSEAYRHLTFEELVERNPTMQEKLAEAANRQDVEQKVEDYYLNVVLEQLPSPGELPPEMRMEIRITTAVLRDGTVLKLIHTRETDNVLPTEIEDLDGSETFPTALYMFLHGVRPEPNVKDPKTVVSDYETLQALADLPTYEEH